MSISSPSIKKLLVNLGENENNQKIIHKCKRRCYLGIQNPYQRFTKKFIIKMRYLM